MGYGKAFAPSPLPAAGRLRRPGGLGASPCGHTIPDACRLFPPDISAFRSPDPNAHSPTHDF